MIKDRMEKIKEFTNSSEMSRVSTWTGFANVPFSA